MASTSSSRARPSSSSSSLKAFDTHAAQQDAVLQKLDIERVDEYFAAVEREEESESAQARLEACITIGCSERSFESTALSRTRACTRRSACTRSRRGSGRTPRRACASSRGTNRGAWRSVSVG